MANTALDWNFSAHEDQVLREVMLRLAPLDPRLVMLFGSRAAGNPRLDSDYDLLVVMELPDPKQPRSVAVRRLLRGLGVPFDLVVYTPQEWEAWKDHPLSLAHRIAREGKLLHGTS